MNTRTRRLLRIALCRYHLRGEPVPIHITAELDAAGVAL